MSAAEPATDIGTADAVTRTVESDPDLDASADDSTEEQDAQVTEAETDTDEIDVVDTSGPAEVDGGPAADAGAVADRRTETAEDVDRSLPAPPHGPLMTTPDGPADDLTRIEGVGPRLERALNDQGIATYGQLAEMTDEQLTELQARLPEFAGRVNGASWVEQATRLRQDG